MDVLLKKIDLYKEQLDHCRPFEPPMLEQLRDYYRIGLTYASNALEGNTLTISETKVVLEDGITVGGKPLRDVYEAVGHGDAYDHMFSLLHQKDITVNDIFELHKLFYQRIDPQSAGCCRSHDVIVTGSTYTFPSPDELPEKLEELGIWMKEARYKLHPVEYAAWLHLLFVSIHPFADGNGRTARLAMNLALIQRGYQMAVVPPASRAEYLSAIARYQHRGDASVFCQFIAEQVLENERDLMRMLHIPLQQAPAIEP